MIIHHAENNRFEYQEDGVVAYLEYTLNDSIWTATHTIVPPQLSGKGIGKQLAKAAIEWAEQRHYAICAECSFVQNYLNKKQNS
jgi:acetyltransferase-like protein